jgi:hypothetical protein
VAVVGRAGSLLRSGNGAAIDACDVVIRVNAVLPIEPAHERHIGTRTDLVYHCKRARQSRIQATRRGIPHWRVRGKARRKAAEIHFINSRKLRPTTGFMAIWAALQCGAEEVHAFGFDFFRSGHYQDREPDGDDYSKPLAWAHSPSEERRAIKRLVERYPTRLFPDKILREALR